MTIGIDIRVLARGTRTGIEEYTLKLLDFLLPLDPSVKYKLFYNAYKKVGLDYPWLELPGVEIKEFAIPNRLLDISSRFFYLPKVDKLLEGIDIFFSPHFFLAPVSKKCKRIVTFHDLSFKHYPEFFSFPKRFWHFSMGPRFQAKNVSKIVAVSQSTKEDLVNIYKINPEKIEVIYSGIGEEFQPLVSEGRKDSQKLKQVKEKYNLPNDFILYFGTIEPRKNIVGLIKAFEALKDRLNQETGATEPVWSGFEARVAKRTSGKIPKTDTKLVIAGARGWLHQDIFKVADESKYKKDIIFTGFVDDEDKVYLYNLAQVFVFPSFFEGFGFPPLEAMACGIPTITSNTSSLPEVVGDGAVMIDPSNIDELAYAMRTVFGDKDLRARLKRRGIRQAQKFSWQRTAERTLEVFQSLI